MDNFTQCLDSSKNFLNFFDTSIAPPLLFYSYIPILLIVLIFGIFILFQEKKSLINRLFFLISLFFSLWIINILIQWTAVYAGIVHFAWQITAILEFPIFIFSFYFVMTFINKKDIDSYQKVIILIITLPIIILLPFIHNAQSFDITYCEAQLGTLWNYIYLMESFVIATTLILGIRSIIKNKQKEGSRASVVILTGTVIFLITFFLSNFIGELTQTYEINLVGPIGMLIFLSGMSFAIVKFKTFNLKLLGSQILIFFLAVSVFSMLFIQRIEYVHYVSLGTLLIVIILGYSLIKGVRKEREQLIKIEKLAKNLKSANDRLQLLDQQKSEFVSLASHQLRGPLTAIKGYISLVLDGDYGKISSDIKDALEKVQTSTNDLAILVGDYLDVSRIELGHMKYTFSMFALDDLLDEVIKEMRPTIEKAGLKLTISVDKLPSNAHGDRNKLKQVILNLMDNSIKYTPEGSLHVSLDRVTDHAILSIKDTGVGIPANVLPNLFQKFSRAPNASKTNIIGTGLGLYVAKQIMNEHKGEIWAESEGEGKGSKFFMKLPLV